MQRVREIDQTIGVNKVEGKEDSGVMAEGCKRMKLQRDREIRRSGYINYMTANSPPITPCQLNKEGSVEIGVQMPSAES